MNDLRTSYFWYGNFDCPRLLGHLHEAEDEAQQWPELHMTIRQARKSYQRDGRLPDFEAWAGLIASLTRSSMEAK